MKSLATTILLLTAFASQTINAQTSYIGCMDLEADEYNILLVLENGQLTATAALETDLQTLIPVTTPIDSVMYLIYLSEYDTNFAYQLKVTADMEKKVELQAWTSGNDSDNYYGSPSDQLTTCHKLKTKPASAILDTNNYDSTIPVFGY